MNILEQLKNDVVNTYEQHKLGNVPSESMKNFLELYIEKAIQAVRDEVQREFPIIEGAEQPTEKSETVHTPEGTVSPAEQASTAPQNNQEVVSTPEQGKVIPFPSSVPNIADLPPLPTQPNGKLPEQEEETTL